MKYLHFFIACSALLFVSPAIAEGEFSSGTGTSSACDTQESGLAALPMGFFSQAGACLAAGICGGMALISPGLFMAPAIYLHPIFSMVLSTGIGFSLTKLKADRKDILLPLFAPILGSALASMLGILGGFIYGLQSGSDSSGRILESVIGMNIGAVLLTGLMSGLVVYSGDLIFASAE